MKKKIIETPVYESVQTGVNIELVWTTNDGNEFKKESEAERHEFYYCKTKMRGIGLPENPTVLDCYCLEDLERYEKDYTYNVDVYNYDKSKLVFPNTYILVEETVHGDDFGKDDNWYDYDTRLDIFTVEEFKKIVNGTLSEIEGI